MLSPCVFPANNSFDFIEKYWVGFVVWQLLFNFPDLVVRAVRNSRRLSNPCSSSLAIELEFEAQLCPTSLNVE